MLSSYFKLYTKEQVLAQTHLRKFETKIGETVQVLENANGVEDALIKSAAKFVIFGVPEDIGIQANGGQGGAPSAWFTFLKSFLNTQSNDFFEGSNVLLLGHLNFAGVAEVIESNATNNEERIAAYRHSVLQIDEAVEDVVKMIAGCGKIPIVISGGHNNAYGCIKGAAKGWYKNGAIPIAQLNVINLDAYAEYMPMEGRHSGNALHYADEDGYLEKYCVLGLHENKLPQNCWLDIANDPFFDFVTYEDIFVLRKQTFPEAVTHAVNFTNDTVCGIEVNLENIIHTGCTLPGVTLAEARQYVQFTASNAKPAYLHIAEAGDRILEHYNATATGHVISYLVSDFIKALS